jgi:hypothetical protein
MVWRMFSSILQTCVGDKNFPEFVDVTRVNPMTLRVRPLFETASITTHESAAILLTLTLYHYYIL